MSFVDRFAGRVLQLQAPLHWRLTLFYTAVLAVLLASLGWFVDRELWQFATLQLEDRVASRATALLGDPMVQAAGASRSVAQPIPQPAVPAKAAALPMVGGLIPKPAPAPPARVTRVSSPIADLAEQAAASDGADVNTTVLNANGAIVKPVAPPAKWQPAPMLSPTMASTALAEGESVGPVQLEMADGRYVVLYRPVADKATTAVVQFASPLDRSVEDVLRTFRLTFAAALVTAVVLSLALGRPLARLALRPLQRLTDRVSDISADDLSAEVPVPPARDHLRELAVAFNSMLARIDRSVQAERRGQEQLRRFLGDASHELRSPLTALIGYNELLLQHADAADTPYIALRMRRELERMNGLVSDLLTLTRLDAANELTTTLEAVDLAEVADEVVESFSRVPGRRQITLRRLTGEVWVNGDRDALERVLQNLVANAVQYTPAGGVIRLEVEARGDQAQLRVVDEGEGIPLEHQARVFDRFYRVDPARARDKGNAGLGLAIVRSIVSQHGGVVLLSSAVGRGSTFTVKLPLLRVGVGVGVGVGERLIAI